MPVAEVIRRAAAIPVPEPEELPRDPLRLPGGAGTRHGARGPPRRRLRRRLQERLLLRGLRRLVCRTRPAAGGRERGRPLCRRGGRARRRGRDPAGRPHGADTDRVLLASGTTATVGSSGSTSASRMTYMASGAVRDACRAALEERERSGGGEVDVERVFRHPRTTPLDPETGQVTGERAHVQLATAAMRVVVEVDVELGLTRVSLDRHRAGRGPRDEPAGRARADRGWHRPGPRAGVDGGDPDPRGEDRERQLHRLPVADDAGRPADRCGARRGPGPRTRPTASRASASRRRSSRPPPSWPRCATRRDGRSTRAPVRPDEICLGAGGRMPRLSAPRTAGRRMS